MKNICIITGSRADYGLLKNLMINVHNDDALNLILFVTGSHMEEKYGYTYKIIEQDNIKIDEKLNTNLIGDGPQDILRSMSIELKSMSDSFKHYNIDLVIILGDRYEILIAAQVALIYNIPIAHLCGGDITIGAYDNAIRNSITQMSKYHFVTCNSSKNNLINMNIDKDRIYCVGNPGLYDIMQFIPENKTIFLNKMKLDEKEKNILVVYHPETLLTEKDNIENFNILIQSILNIKNFHKTNIIFIETNADNYNNYIFEKIQDITANNPNIYSYKSLERADYLNLMYYCNIFIGNSSSGIYEVPLFKKITLNIGKRQLGRTCGRSIIHLDYSTEIITKAINDNLNKININDSIFLEDYPYKLCNSSEEIIKIIKNNFVNDNIPKYAVIGGGGHARVIIDALFEIKKKNNINIVGYYDDNCKTPYRNIKMLGKISDIKNNDTMNNDTVNNNIFYICGIGNLETRNSIICKFDKLNWGNVIHPSAVISETVILGKNIFINAGVIINSQSVIKNHTIINTNSVIEHDVLIESNCHIAPSVTICGHVTIKENTFIGCGTTVIHKNKKGFITIGKNNFLNANTLILHSTLDNMKIKGTY